MIGKSARVVFGSTMRMRGVSSAGRAPALQAGGHRFDPGTLHWKVAAHRAGARRRRLRGAYWTSSCGSSRQSTRMARASADRPRPQRCRDADRPRRRAVVALDGAGRSRAWRKRDVGVSFGCHDIRVPMSANTRLTSIFTSSRLKNGPKTELRSFAYFSGGAMRHSRALRLSAILALGATAAVMLAAAASAGQIFRETFHEEDTFVLDGRVHAVPHGPDGLPYFGVHFVRTDVFTNLANDKSVTGVVNEIDKDLRVTDNGDGTLTILVLATGNFVLYGEDGKAIARNPGQIRFEILIDHGGTPTDPSDDEFLAFLGVVKGSTGRSDDFCAAAVPALTG